MSRVVDPEVLRCFRPDPPPEWPDLHRWHSNSAFGCIPLSLSSITAWIALEGGKNGCDATHLRHIVHRHTAATATASSGCYRVDPPLTDSDSEERKANDSEPALDMATMEYWWTHLRSSPALSFTHTDTEASTASGSLTLTDDGVLLPPCHRTLIHREALHQPFATIIARHSTLRVTASLAMRHAVLGWQPKSSNPALTDTLAVNYPSDKNTGKESKDSNAQSEESHGLLRTSYCLLETLGKAAYCGLYQNHAHAMFGSSHSLSSLYPTIKWLKQQHLIVTTNEFSKVKLYHREWKHRGDSCLSFRLLRTHYYRQWLNGLDARQRRRHQHTRESVHSDSELISVDDTEDAHYEDESEWKVQSSPALVYELTWQAQVFRLIHNSGIRGCSSIDIRDALGDLGLKSFDKLITAVNDIHRIKAVADRAGKQFIYRYYTQDNFARMNQQQAVKPERTLPETEEDVPTIVPAFFSAKTHGKNRNKRPAAAASSSALPIIPVLTQSQSQVAVMDIAGGEPAVDVDASLAKATEPSPPSSSRPVPATKGRRGGQSTMTLITRRRRQFVLEELETQPGMLMVSQTMSKKMTKKFYPEPPMYNQTAKSFYQSMATDGLLQLYPFIFPSKEGRSLQPVTVIRKRDRNEVLDSETESAIQAQAKEMAVNELLTRHVNDAGARRGKRDRGNDSDEDSDRESNNENSGDSDSDASSSDDDARPRSLQSRVSVYEISRMLFGFLRPSIARSRYLLAQLWTDYQTGPNPLVTRASDTGRLVFKYQTFVHEMLYKDFLVLSGIDEEDLSAAPDAMSEDYYSLPLSKLPAHIDAIINRHRKRNNVFHRILNILCELKLLDDYDSVRTTAVPLTTLALPRSVNNINSNPMIQEYSLAPTYKLGAQSLDLSSHIHRQTVWHHLRTISRRANVSRRQAECDALGIRDAIVKAHLMSTRHWQLQTIFRVHERKQLEMFESASDEPLTMAQMQRAAQVIQRPVGMVVLFYARRRYPTLAAIHDSVQSYVHVDDQSKKLGNMMAPKRKLVDDGTKVLRSKRQRRADTTSESKQTDTENSSMVDAEMEAEENKADPDYAIDSELDGDSDDDGETKKRQRWTVQHHERLVAAYCEWMEINDLDYQTAKLEISPPEGLMFHSVLTKLLPMMAVIENMEHPSTEPQPVSVLESEERNVRVSENEQKLLQAKKDFVLHGTTMPSAAPISPSRALVHGQPKSETAAAPIGPFDTPFNALAKARFDFLATKFPEFTLNQIKAHIRFVRRKLQVPRLRSALLKITAVPNIEAMLASEPDLVALLNITTVIVLASDSEYEADHAHFATDAYSEQQLCVVLRAMSKDHLITKRRNTNTGHRRAYRATRMYEEALKAFSSVDSKAVSECQEMLASVMGGEYGAVFAVSESSSVGESWAVIEAFDRGAFDFEPPTERPFESKPSYDEMKDDDGNDDADDEDQQADNGEFKYLRSQLLQSSWLSFVPATLRDFQDYSQQSGPKAGSVSDTSVGIGEYLPEWQSRFSVDTPFADHVVELVDRFPSENASEDLSMTDTAVSDSGLLASISTPVQHEQLLIRTRFAAPATVTLSQRIVSEVEAAGSRGLTVEQLIGNVSKHSTEVLSTSLTSQSLTPIPIITTLSSTFDFALLRALFGNLAFAAPCHTHTRYVAQQYSSHWQFPDYRAVSAIVDEERQWQRRCTGSDSVDDHAALNSPLYGPSAIGPTPWRKMDGDINSEVLGKLIDAVVTAISAATEGVSVKEISAQLPVWSPVHVRQGLATLIADDRIQRRVTGDSEDDVRYFPSPTLASFHWTRMEM